MTIGFFALLQACLGKGPSVQEAQSAAEAKIRKQASFDLQCDAAKLQLQQVDTNQNYTAAFYTYGVSGCDKQATFKAACTGNSQCTVGKESEVQKK